MSLQAIHCEGCHGTGRVLKEDTYYVVCLGCEGTGLIRLPPEQNNLRGFFSAMTTGDSSANILVTGGGIPETKGTIREGNVGYEFLLIICEDKKYAFLLPYNAIAGVRIDMDDASTATIYLTGKNS